MEGRRIGASYYSLANPYMLNNRQFVRISDRLRLFKDHFFLNLSYDYMIDNLGEQRTQTRENSSVSGSTTIRITDKLPSLTVGYRYFLGNTFSNLQENYAIENTNIFGSLQYTLRLDPMTFQLGFARNDMNLISDVMANNHQESNSLTFSAAFKNIAGLTAQGTQTQYYYDGVRRPQAYLTAQI